MTRLLRCLCCSMLSWSVAAAGQKSNLRRPEGPLVAASLIEPVGLQTSVEDELRVMSGQASVIFAGQVLSVKMSGSGAGTGWVEVEFRVEEAIRGCVGQGTYLLREWAGLWAGGVIRYRVGERLLMLLHGPAASGLSSPVGGQDGAIPITAGAPKVGDIGEQAVDLRWIQARLLRTTGSAGEGRVHGRATVPVGQAMLVGRKQMPMATRKDSTMRNNLRQAPGQLVEANYVEPVAPLGGGGGLTLRGVLAMLGAWEAQQASAQR
jgi:hypothetical protein